MNPLNQTTPPRIHRTCFDGLLALTVLFPFIGFIPGIDIQPNFVLVGFATVFAVLVLRPHQGLGRLALQLLVVLILSFLIRFTFGENGLNGRYIATYLLALIVPFLMWHLVYKGNLLIVSRLLPVAMLTYVLVGVVQLLVSPYFLAALVPRPMTDVTTLIATDRGVRSLASEPSTFGKVLTYLNVLYIYFSLYPTFDRVKARRVMYGSTALFGANLLLAQSAYAIAIHALVLMAIMWVVDRRGLLLGITGFGLMVGALLITQIGDARLLLIARSVFAIDLEFLMRQGAFARLMNIPISIYGGLAALPFGFGNSNLTVPGRFEILGMHYEFLIGKRNVGGFVELFLRFGVIGVMALGVYARMLWRIGRMRVQREGRSLRLGIGLAIAIVLLTFPDGSTADPLAWFTIFIILRGAMMLRPAMQTTHSLS